MKDKVQKLVGEFDAKYKRVKNSDIPLLSDLNSVEQIGMIRHQVKKRPKGQYELVSIYYPELDDLDLPDLSKLDDSLVDNAYDEFDRQLVEIVGKSTTWVGPPDDEHSLGVHFSDIHVPVMIL